MEVEFSVDGELVRSPQGITLAGALYFLGRRNFRTTSKERKPSAKPVLTIGMNTLRGVMSPSPQNKGWTTGV